MAIAFESDLELPRDPVEPLQAATKQYVDANSEILLPPDDGRVYALRRQPDSDQVQFVEVTGEPPPAEGDGFPMTAQMYRPYMAEKEVRNGDEWWACHGLPFHGPDYPEIVAMKSVAPYYKNLLPLMQSATLPAGNEITLSVGNIGTAFYMFDGNFSNNWQGMPGPTLSQSNMITRKIPAPLGRITGYSIVSQYSSTISYPTEWVLQASLNGSTWQTIDNRKNVTWDPAARGAVRQVFELPTPYEGAALYFRWAFSKSTGTGYIAISELELHDSITQYAVPKKADDANGCPFFVKMKSGLPSDHLQIGDRVLLGQTDEKYVDEFGRTWLACNMNTHEVVDYPDLVDKKGVRHFENGEVVPVLLSNLVPGTYPVTVSSEATAPNTRWKPFDGNGTVYWATASTVKSGWIQVELPRSILINAYDLKTSNTQDNTPQDWTVEVSDDGTNWTVIDRQTGNIALIDRKFTVATPRRGKFVRLNVSSIVRGTCVAVFRLQYFSNEYDMIQMPNYNPSNENRLYMLAKLPNT